MQTLTTKITMPKKEIDETAPVTAGQGRTTMERYRLQVDRQTKNSYATHDAAQAVAAIKKAHPVVQVSIYDAKDSEITVL